MKTRSPAAVLLVALLVVLAAGVPAARPAVAATSDDRSKLAQIQAREQAVKVQLNLAVASDDAVVAEVLRLQGAVATEEALVAADQSALDAANARVASAADRIATLTAQGSAARAALVARAVSLYENPLQSDTLLFSGVESFDQLSTRQELANAVQARTSDLIDAVRQQRITEQAATRDLSSAQALAASRKTAAVTEAQRLQEALSSDQQAHAALVAKINDGEGQVAGYQAQEAALSAQIAAAQARDATVASFSGVTVIGPVGSYGLQWPIHGVVTQEFGHNGHPGIDIAAAYGTPIVASGTGTVIYASWESGYGNYTCIDHGGGISTCYGHQSKIVVTVGEHVTRGEYIGNEGSTGYSTGPHVHFEVRVNGAVRNPRLFVPGNP